MREPLLQYLNYADTGSRQGYIHFIYASYLKRRTVHSSLYTFYQYVLTFAETQYSHN